MAKSKGKRRKYRRRKSPYKMNLKKGTVYSLSSVFLIFFSIILLFSYSRNGILITKINDLLTTSFGFLSFLVPIDLIFLAIFATRIKGSLTRPNIVLGFSVFAVCLMSLLKSGSFGQQMYDFINPFLGSLSIVMFIAGVAIGLIVFLNLSFDQIYYSFKGIPGKGPSQIARKPIVVKEAGKQIEIKGMKDVKQIAPLMDSTKPPVINEKRSNEKPMQNMPLTDDIILNKPLEIGVWEYPPVSLLSERQDKKADRGDIKKIADTIEKTLQSFGINARVAEINVGPSVTQYAMQIALGTKLSKITALSNDLALATEAPTGQIRIEAPIPGRNLVGVEIPNRSLEIVSLKTMLLSNVMHKVKSKLAVPLGLDVAGNPLIIDIAKMPHVLVAGTTGSGKSVLINSFIASLLFRSAPTEVKMIMIDPKRVELTAYNEIPHLLYPVVVEPAESVSALKWALKEMDRRYVEFAKNGVKNIDSYNELAGFQALPYIVIFIDELADIMALAPVEVEDSIARLAQMSRATGIHLVVSTQRPSVDIITGLIKANIPCRIAFNVSSMVDSKVIIDTPGAEKLLGRGDMLYIPPDQAKPTRIQGSFVSEQDTKRLVNFIRSKNIPVEYTQEIVEQEVNVKRSGANMGNLSGGKGRDEFFEQAVRIVCQYDRASSSLLQRRLSIGFARAARIIDQLEEAGIVSPGEGSKPRDVIIKNPEEILRTLSE